MQESAPSSGFSAWFIARPVATVLLTLAIVMLGVFAFPRLPVAPLPQADFPTIRITANLPGASPETMASSVATPLETEFTGIPGITEMTSTSSLGRTTITLQFVLERDIDSAAQEVQAAINGVANQLPGDMPTLPTWRKVNPGDSPIIVLSMRSDTIPLTELSDLAETIVARQLSQLPGVAEANVIGQQKPAIRIKARMDRMAANSLTMADIRAAVQNASVNRAKGAVFGEKSITTLQTNDQLFTPQEYGDIVVAYRNNVPVHIRDVADVRMGAENEYVQLWPNGKPGVGAIILRQPGANIVATADAITNMLPILRERLPADVELSTLNDRTRTIRSSLQEVELTLGITLVLVVLIMGIFLRDLASMMIVGTVLGVSLIATFAAMYVLGFSLNNLTLVALVIAVGFIVDDAIVVIENIHRYLENGETPLAAALRGSKEIGFTVISITFSLIAAFIPLLFMDGIVGRLFREFSLTVTVALLISVVASLSLAPMMAAKLMRGNGHKNENGKKSFSERLVERYDSGLTWMLAHQRLGLLMFSVTIGIAVFAYIQIPKGFFPLQDTAFVLGTTQAADDISYTEMEAKHKALEAIVSKDPAILRYTHAIGATGGSSSMSSGRFWIVLKDRNQRDVSAEGFINRLRPQLAAVPGITLSLRSAQDINLSAAPSSAQYVYTLKAENNDELSLWTERMTQEMIKDPAFRDVRHDMQMGGRMQDITIDRVAAARYGLTVDDIDQVLYDSFGQRQISEYQTQLNQYKIVLESDADLRGRLSSLDYFHLRSPLTGEMVPLSAVTKIEPQRAGPLVINRNGQYPAANISFNLAPSYALGQAANRIENIRTEIGMPESVSGQPQGAAKIFAETLKSQPVLILAAILAVYIILGVLYESFSTPLTILSTLPSAGIGAILFLWLWQLDFSIMALIGIILLIGIVKKNGILMVDFALHAQRNLGLNAQDAIHRAAITRFRPIMMTTIAAMLAAIPLMLGHGTGAELRQPLGVAVFGGLLISQALTLFSTPVIYIALDRLFHRGKRS